MRAKRSSNDHPLGPIQAEYHDRRLSWRDLVLFFTPACLAVLLPWAYGTWRGWLASQQYGPVAAQAWGPPWLTLAALALLPLLLLAWIRLRRAARWVHLHRAGLHIHTAWGIHRQLPWEQIRGIAYQSSQYSFFGHIYHTRHELRLHRATGRPLQLDPHLKDLGELAARIKARRYPRLLSDLRARQHNGETLAFGKLLLQPQGLQVARQCYPWAQIRQLNLEAARLVVELQDQRHLSIPAIHLPNLELLLQLIREGVEA